MGKVNRSWPTHYDIDNKPTHGLENYMTYYSGMVSHRGHNCISSALTILDSALTS